MEGRLPGSTSVRKRALRVGGFVPFTSIDYPDKLAAVVFVQGCSWRCVYCHNPHLQPRGDDGAASTAAWPDVLNTLARRRGLIDGVVFSGGEPTIDPGLGAAMADVRGLGFSVGLHTAGIYPSRLRGVLALVDWVGFDVKAPLDEPDSLERVVGVRTDPERVEKSLRAVIDSGVRFECRTTVHPVFLRGADIIRLGTRLALLGVRSYALQISRPVTALGNALRPVPEDYPDRGTLARLRELFPSFTVRRA